jgi:hypothetical protein
VFVAKLCLCVYQGKERVVWIAFYVPWQALGSQGVAQDVQVGIVNRILFVSAGGDQTKRVGVENLAAAEGGFENLTVSLAAV